MAEFRKWRVDFDANETGVVDKRRVPDPPGYEASAGREVSTSGGARGGADLATKQAAVNGRAYGQLKSVAFLCFIMYMSGSQIHLFSIMTTVSGIYQPLMAIVNSEKMFPEELSEGGKLNILYPRLLYCLIQAGGLAFALWKLNGMGLLPTHASDYVSALAVPRALEFSSGGVQLGV
ncbi:hypothetical protein WJX81_008162 [Elliptochloris bilobata]|uniref:ER membrane protein complex subunit 4 n=1 Tax=Elliptochloris bilobata TaxID=381761 RepID=A0AAW1S7I6_9CHLO